MSKFLKLISVIILSLLTITCDSGSGGGGSGGGFGPGGGSDSGSNSGFSNDAANNITGADNEVVCTVKVDSRSFDEDAFISAIADEVGCTIDDIQITNVEETNLVAYIAFIFISDNANDLLEEIQTQLADGTVGDFEAMMIIANMGDDIACTLGEDCADICGGDAMEDACGECNGDSSSCGLDSYVGLYQINSFRTYDGADLDTGHCSGSIVDQGEAINGIIDLSNSYNNDTNCSDCYCEFGSFQLEITEYVEFKANGEYNRALLWDNGFSESTYCYGVCSNGDNSGECNCHIREEDEYEIELEVGIWSVSDEYPMLILQEIGFEWEWENESHEYTCDDNGEVITVSNGCMQTWEFDSSYYENDWEPVENFEKTLYGFNIHDIFYNEDNTEIEGCTIIQYNKISGYPTISGCTDPFANNYLPLATIDDGSCNAECGDIIRGNDREHNNSKEKYSFPSFK